jgi:hypothetical protein
MIGSWQTPSAPQPLWAAMLVALGVQPGIGKDTRDAGMQECRNTSTRHAESNALSEQPDVPGNPGVLRVLRGLRGLHDLHDLQEKR